MVHTRHTGAISTRGHFKKRSQKYFFPMSTLVHFRSPRVDIDFQQQGVHFLEMTMVYRDQRMIRSSSRDLVLYFCCKNPHAKYCMSNRVAALMHKQAYSGDKLRRINLD